MIFGVPLFLWQCKLSAVVKTPIRPLRATVQYKNSGGVLPPSVDHQKKILGVGLGEMFLFSHELGEFSGKTLWPLRLLTLNREYACVITC